MADSGFIEQCKQDITLANSMERLVDRYYSTYREIWENISIFDKEDLRQEVLLRLVESEHAGRCGSFSIAEGFLKDRLKIARGRAEIIHTVPLSGKETAEQGTIWTAENSGLMGRVPHSPGLVRD